MSDFENIEYTIPVINEFKPLIDAASTTIKTISTTTEILSTACKIVGPLLKLVDGPVLAIGETVRTAILAVLDDYDTATVNAFHFYPSARYNVPTYSLFLDAVDQTFENAQDVVTPTSGAIVWLVSARTTDELIPSINALRSLFGQPVFDEPAVELVRDQVADFETTLEQVNTNQLLPPIKDVTRSINQATGLLRDASGFAGMVDDLIATLDAKVQQFQTIAENLERALEALEALGAISISRVVLSGLSDNASVGAALRQVGDAPAPSDLVAGSIFVYDSVFATFFEGLL